MGLHLLQPTARKRMTGDNGGPSETTLQCVPCTLAQYRRRVRTFPSWSSGPCLQIFPPGTGSFLLPNFHGYNFIPHLLCCNSSHATQRRSQRRGYFYIFLPGDGISTGHGCHATSDHCTEPPQPHDIRMKSRAHPATRYFSVSLASKLPSFSVKSIPKKTKTEPALKVVPAPLFIPPTQAPKPSSSHPILDFSEASAVVMEPWKGSSGSRSSQIQDSQADPNFPSTGSDWFHHALMSRSTRP